MENAVIQRLKKVIEQKRLSVTALGKTIGIHPSTLNRQFNGESAMTLGTVDAFLQYFNDISAEWLLRGEGEMIKTESHSKVSEKEFVVYVTEDGTLKLKR